MLRIGETRLWQAVVHQCLRDILSYNPRVRDEAVIFLRRQTVDLNMLCDLADVIPEKVISAARYLVELGPQEGVVYLSRLMRRTTDEVTSRDQGNNKD